MDKFYCPNCEAKEHQCYACGELGCSDETTGAMQEVSFFLCFCNEVIKCFHLRCQYTGLYLQNINNTASFPMCTITSQKRMLKLLTSTSMWKVGLPQYLHWSFFSKFTLISLYGWQNLRLLTLLKYFLQVFVCDAAMCGHFYHPMCAAELILRDSDKIEQTALAQMIKEGKGFVCPMHKCWKCGKGEVKEERDLQFGICRRCPRVWHRKCFPA